MACFTCPGQATVTIIEQFGKVRGDPETSCYHPACRAATLHLMLTSLCSHVLICFLAAVPPSRQLRVQLHQLLLR